jgi:putative oxidoreductase
LAELAAPRNAKKRHQEQRQAERQPTTPAAIWVGSRRPAAKITSLAVFVSVLGYWYRSRPHEPARLGGNVMSQEANRSSHPLLSCTDGIAAGMNDTLLLIGRILIALVFLLTAWFGSPNAGYLTSLGYPSPSAMSLLAVIVEFIVVVSLVFGIATRYGALLGLLFVIVATVTAHRYWGYPQAQQGIQYIFLTKNLAIAGGLLLLFVTGAGRFSVDHMLSGRR